MREGKQHIMRLRKSQKKKIQHKILDSTKKERLDYKIIEQFERRELDFMHSYLSSSNNNINFTNYNNTLSKKPENLISS